MSSNSEFSRNWKGAEQNTVACLGFKLGGVMVRSFSFGLCLLSFFAALASGVGAQTQSLDTLCSEQMEKASPAIPLVLVQESPANYNAGFALVVGKDGTLLTAYHLLENARSVQIRFKESGIFNEVQLLGVDRERDVAAIRIPADGLPVLPAATPSTVKTGDPICVVPHSAVRLWTSRGGAFVSSDLAWRMELAGDVGIQPDTMLLEFWVDANAGARGGIVLDSQGRALGMLVGRLQGKKTIAVSDPFALLFGGGEALVDIQKSIGYAVPLDDVLGLAGAPATQLFDPGSKLQSLAESKDRDFILRNFRTLFVDAQQAKWFGSTEVKSALTNDGEFHGMRIRIVDDPVFADVILEIGHTYVHDFAWEYPFSLKHSNTGIELLSGRGVAPQPGPSGAASTTKEIIRRLVPYRNASTREE